MVRVGLAADMYCPLRRLFDDVVNHGFFAPRSDAGSKQDQVGAKRRHACLIDGRLSDVIASLR